MLKKLIVSNLIIISLTIFGCTSTPTSKNWVNEEHISNAMSYIETYYSGRMYLYIPGSGRINLDNIRDELISDNTYEIDSIEPFHSNEESYITIHYKNIRNESTLRQVLRFSLSLSRTGNPIDYNYYFPELASNASFIYTSNFYNWSWLWKIMETKRERENILNQYSQNGNIRIRSLSSISPLTDNLSIGELFSYSGSPYRTREISSNQYVTIVDDKVRLEDAIIINNQEFNFCLFDIIEVYWVGAQQYILLYNYILKYVGRTEIITTGGFVRSLPVFEIQDRIPVIQKPTISGARRNSHINF